MQVVLLAAMTSDGFIARDKNEISTGWTSREDAQWFSQKTKEIGICIMGRTTFQTIGRPLADRSTIILTSQPSFFDQLHIPVLEQLEGTLPELVTTNVAPQELVNDLASRGYEAVAICGGASVYAQCMKANLVTKLYLTIEPVFFGQGVPLFSEALDVKLRLVKTHQLSEQTIVRELDVVSFV